MRTPSINKNHEFRRLYYRGKHSSGRLLAVYCMKTRRDHNRLGITVGVKVGGAVQRNYVRRRIRESYRLMEPQIKTGFDLVVVARNGAAAVDYRRINAELRARLQHLDLLNT